MDAPTDRYAVSALRNKRASLSGEIVEIKRKLHVRENALRHVDAVLRLLHPDSNPSDVPIKRPTRIKIFREGALGRLVTRAMRNKSSPISTPEITAAVIQASDFGEDTRSAMAAHVRANLRYLVTVGRVVKFGTGVTARWALSDEMPCSEA
jgi:hypothetical protein